MTNLVIAFNLGYGIQKIKYADGKSKDFYQVGISRNTTGISVYIIDIKDKNLTTNKREKRQHRFH